MILLSYFSHLQTIINAIIAIIPVTRKHIIIVNFLLFSLSSEADFVGGLSNLSESRSKDGMTCENKNMKLLVVSPTCNRPVGIESLLEQVF